jgi:hypothetical protein
VLCKAGRRRTRAAQLLAETDLYSGEKLDDAVKLVVSAVERAERQYHDRFIEKIERRYLAYRGLADNGGKGGGKDDFRRDDEEDWHSNVTTPYVLQTCEGMLATMLEPSPSFNVQPRPKPDEPMAEVLQRIMGIEAVEQTLKYALERASFAQVQRDFMQQDMIAGLSVLKDYWHRERRDVTRLVPELIGIEDAYGSIVDSVTSQKEETTKNVLVADDACVEVVDVRDFFWPSQAPSVKKAEYLIHRTWETTASLKRKQDMGYIRDVSKLSTPAVGERLSDITKREMRLRNIDRTQSLHEILEYWTPERTITVGDRMVLLSDRKNPLWNGRQPFIVCSSMPDAFQIPGMSVVEALAQLQEMLWTLQNQRLDVVRMLANLITLIRSDVDDPEAFEWAPNAQWFVEDPGQVDTLKIDPTVANITLQAESMLKGDLQNIMGGLPYASGADSTTIDQQTATGVSIITTIAQRIIQSRKQQYLWSYAQLGKHFLLLYQQFLRDDRVVQIVGRRGAEAYRSISPLEIQGDFDVTIDVTSDSLVRQERRAEAQSLLQMAAGVAPVMAQSGVAINLRPFMEKVLDAYDVPDKERFFMPAQVQAGVAAQTPPPGAGPQPQQNGAPPAPTQGVTNVPAAAGPMSPSNVDTMSPQAAMSRLMSQSGGANNAPAP